MIPERQYLEESWYAEEEQVQFKVYTNNKHKHKKRHLKKLSPKSKMILCLVFVFAFSLTYVSLEARITQVGYVVNELQTDIAEVQKNNDRMMLEVEALASPDRIAQYAAESEGMVFAAQSNVIYADIDLQSKVAEDAAAAENSVSTVADSNETVNENSVADSDKNFLVSAFSSVLDKFSAGRNNAATIAK